VRCVTVKPSIQRSAAAILSVALLTGHRVRAFESKMTEYRLHLLFGGTAFSLLAALIVPVTLLMTVAAFQCGEEITEDIGEFDSKDAALRAAIPKLAAEMRRCTEAETYRIIFFAPETHPWHQGIGRRSVLFYRPSMTVGYEADALSGTIGKTYVVDDSAVQSIAQKGGTLDDFAEYDSHR
jgi:hypothetical protein